MNNVRKARPVLVGRGCVCMCALKVDKEFGYCTGARRFDTMPSWVPKDATLQEFYVHYVVYSEAEAEWRRDGRIGNGILKASQRMMGQFSASHRYEAQYVLCRQVFLPLASPLRFL